MTPGNRRVSGSFAEDAPSEPSPSREKRTWPARIASTLRTAAGLLLVVVSSLGVAWVGRHHVLSSPRFGITSIDVTGNARRSAEVIVAESGLLLGTNVFAADLDAARARILSDRWIEEASLVRRLPGAIFVRVTERKAAVLVALGDLFLATPEGDPFKTLETGDPVDLPLLTGLRPESLAEDRDAATRTIRRAIDLAGEFERCDLARRAPLQEVHVGPDGAFTLIVGHAGTQVVLGGPPFRRKLEQAARVVLELDRRGARADAIMLDNDARPERVVVRMR